MPFCITFTRDSEVQRSLRASLSGAHAVAHASSWDRLVYIVRERPATCVVLDERALPAFMGPKGSITELKRSFPSIALVVMARPDADPYRLFHLGRAGIENLALGRSDDLGVEVPEAVERALGRGAHALVARVVTPYLPARETRALRLAFDGAQRGWKTRDLACRAGLTRPHLSVRLRTVGLPSAGHLLVWARLLLAARWLEDPGRSAESVSRQLDYSSGAAFRRALRNYVDATPTEVRDGGGLSFALDRFVGACGFGRLRKPGRSVA
jgi:AraC-like DNA-binding protein